MAQLSHGKKKWVVLAAVAHPDDIEFVMAGTLLRFKAAGAEIHMWNLANGSCGTATHTQEEIVRMRWQEAQDAARVAGATAHEPICDDLGIFYDWLAR
jgi:LmbE family N-acetylglucosaminyl deacetylase